MDGDMNEFKTVIIFGDMWWAMSMNTSPTVGISCGELLVDEHFTNCWDIMWI